MSTARPSIDDILEGVKRRITAPKHFTPNSIVGFINDAEIIFGLKGKNEPHFLLDLSKIKQASLLGTLIIYKLIEFAVTHNCFFKPMTLLEPPIREALDKYGFNSLVFAYISKQEAEKEYKQLKISVGDNFIIAPTALLRNDKQSKETLHHKYLPQIKKYYEANTKAVSMIFLALSEILLNFWEHAVEDTKSIIVANGTKQNIEIACADTGDGIISTLSIDDLIKKKTKEDILKLALQKGVTSKKNTNHMGYGLWILDEIVTKAKGKMHIYSQGVYYYNEYGKKKTGSCGFWQGTIIYLSLPLDHPVTLSDIDVPLNTFDLKINWA